MTSIPVVSFGPRELHERFFGKKHSTPAAVPLTLRTIPPPLSVVKRGDGEYWCRKCQAHVPLLATYTGPGGVLVHGPDRHPVVRENQLR